VLEAMTTPADRPLGWTITERLVRTMEFDPYLSLKALADYSGLCVRTLRDHINDPVRPLPSYRLGGKILVRRGEFDAWMVWHRHVGPIGLDGIVDSVIGPSKTRRS
jgi:helix-turn-helix protein